MAKILERVWARLRRTKTPSDPSKDWTTAGKTYWPSQGMGHGSNVPQNYVPPADEGRPRR